MTGPYDIRWGMYIMRAASIWDLLDSQIPGTKGVWILNESRTPITVVSIQQMYQGHAREAAMLTAGCWAAPYLNRYIVLVDEDIDPANIPDLLFAVATRCDPETSIDMIKGFKGGHSDPLLSPEKRRLNDISFSKGILYACKPFAWKDQFPVRTRMSEELQCKTREKWGTFLFGAT
jgi:3-polyprenyl-4-hydroxybenzoate decarboxylase